MKKILRFFAQMAVALAVLSVVSFAVAKDSNTVTWTYSNDYGVVDSIVYRFPDNYRIAEDQTGLFKRGTKAHPLVTDFFGSLPKVVDVYLTDRVVTIHGMKPEEANVTAQAILEKHLKRKLQLREEVFWQIPLKRK